MAAGFLEGGLDAPAADEPAQDVHRVGVQVGAQEGLRFLFTFWVAHQHPADRHLHAGVVPERGAGGDVEGAFGAAIPAIDPDPVPERGAGGDVEAAFGAAIPAIDPDPVPERGAGGDVEAAFGAAIPAIDPDPMPGRAGSASCSSKLGRRAPLTRGRPSVPGIRGGAGSYRPGSSRSREIMHRCRPTSRRSSIAEKLLSPTAITRRPGSQRAVWSNTWRAQSVGFLCRWPRSVAERSEGASTLRKGSAQTQPAQGMGASSITHNQRRPLALTKWPWLDRTGSR